MTVVVLLLLMILPQLTCAEINLFLATRDKSAYLQQPSQYEPIDRRMPLDSAPETIYVQKHPVLRISFQEVDAVSIVSRRTYSDPATAVEEMRKFGESGDPSKNGDRYYEATFQLSVAAQKRLETVLRKFSGQLVDLRLGQSRLGVARLAGPQPVRAVAIDLEEPSRPRIEAIFAPLQTKIVWR